MYLSVNPYESSLLTLMYPTHVTLLQSTCKPSQWSLNELSCYPLVNFHVESQQLIKFALASASSAGHHSTMDQDLCISCVSPMYPLVNPHISPVYIPAEDRKMGLSLISSSAVPFCPLWLKGPLDIAFWHGEPSFISWQTQRGLIFFYQKRGGELSIRIKQSLRYHMWGILLFILKPLITVCEVRGSNIRRGMWEVCESMWRIGRGVCEEHMRDTWGVHRGYMWSICVIHEVYQGGI